MQDESKFTNNFEASDDDKISRLDFEEHSRASGIHPFASRGSGRVDSQSSFSSMLSKFRISLGFEFWFPSNVIGRNSAVNSEDNWLFGVLVLTNTVGISCSRGLLWIEEWI